MPAVPECLGHFVTRHALDRESDDAGLGIGAARADDPHAGYGVEARAQRFRLAAGLLRDGLGSPDAVHEIETCAETLVEHARRRSGLVLAGCAIGRVRPPKGLQYPLRVFPHIEKPGTHGREHPLVAVGGVEIAAHVMQVHRKLPDGLAAIPERENAALPRERADLPGGQPGPGVRRDVA